MANIRKRVNANGETSYQVQVRLKGYPKETASFKRKTDAQRWAQSTESAIREGRYFKSSISKQKTFADMIDRYHTDVLAHKKNPRNQKQYLKWWRSELGEYVLADISSSTIVETRSKLVGKKNRFGKVISKTTANRYMQALGHVFNIAMNEWEWIKDNPVSRIKKFKENRGRVRFLSDEERVSLLKACRKSKNPYLHDIVILAISTGARKSELLELEWKNVQFDREAIILEETKNGERRYLPLKSLALEIMKDIYEARNPDCPYVFPSEMVKKDLKTGKLIYQPIDIRTAWENAVETAQIKDFRFHDLRHTAASFLAMNGATLAEIAEILGHKTLQMVKRYAHLSEAHTSKVVESMNKKIFGDMV